MATVDIVIAHYCTFRLLRACLRNILDHTDPGQAEVIVVDNGQCPEAVAWMKGAHPYLRLIERREFHQDAKGDYWRDAGGAYDLGARESAADYILTVHTDTMVRSQGWIDAIFMDGQPCAGIGMNCYGDRPPGFLERTVRGRDLGEWFSDPRVKELTEKCHDWPHGHFSLWRRQPLVDCIEDGFGWARDGEGYILTVEMMRRNQPVKVLPAGWYDEFVQHIGKATRTTNGLLQPDQMVERFRKRTEAVVEFITADKSVDKFWRERGL